MSLFKGRQFLLHRRLYVRIITFQTADGERNKDITSASASGAARCSSGDWHLQLCESSGCTVMLLLASCLWPSLSPFKPWLPSRQPSLAAACATAALLDSCPFGRGTASAAAASFRRRILRDAFEFFAIGRRDGSPVKEQSIDSRRVAHGVQGHFRSHYIAHNQRKG